VTGSGQEGDRTAEKVAALAQLGLVLFAADRDRRGVDWGAIRCRNHAIGDRSDGHRGHGQNGAVSWLDSVQRVNWTSQVTSMGRSVAADVHPEQNRKKEERTPARSPCLCHSNTLFLKASISARRLSQCRRDPSRVQPHPGCNRSIGRTHPHSPPEPPQQSRSASRLPHSTNPPSHPQP